jgi:GrpB-like predicted nucleotidyltransferase (UPF0157 family)
VPSEQFAPELPSNAEDPAPDPAVRFEEYDPDWADEFEREAAALREALGAVALRIDHVGSTSVPGLGGKPVIDIQVSVKGLDPQAPYRVPLERIGYRYAPDARFPHRYFGKPAERPRRYHVHVVEVGSYEEWRGLAVRDFLRKHTDECDRYATLKRELAERFPSDRLSYVRGKATYMTELQTRALAWAEKD